MDIEEIYQLVQSTWTGFTWKDLNKINQRDSYYFYTEEKPGFEITISHHTQKENIYTVMVQSDFVAECMTGNQTQAVLAYIKTEDPQKGVKEAFTVASDQITSSVNRIIPFWEKVIRAEKG